MLINTIKNGRECIKIDTTCKDNLNSSNIISNNVATIGISCNITANYVGTIDNISNIITNYVGSFGNNCNIIAYNVGTIGNNSNIIDDYVDKIYITYNNTIMKYE